MPKIELLSIESTVTSEAAFIISDTDPPAITFESTTICRHGTLTAKYHLSHKLPPATAAQLMTDPHLIATIQRQFKDRHFKRTVATHLVGGASAGIRSALIAAFKEHRLDLGRVTKVQESKPGSIPRPRGQFSPWTKKTISKAILEALSRLYLDPHKTYAKINEELQQMHQDIAPKSGEALRALCRRLKVDVRLLKSGE